MSRAPGRAGIAAAAATDRRRGEEPTSGRPKHSEKITEDSVYVQCPSRTYLGCCCECPKLFNHLSPTEGPQPPNMIENGLGHLMFRHAQAAAAAHNSQADLLARLGRPVPRLPFPLPFPFFPGAAAAAAAVSAGSKFPPTPGHFDVRSRLPSLVSPIGLPTRPLPPDLAQTSPRNPYSEEPLSPDGNKSFTFVFKDLL